MDFTKLQEALLEIDAQRRVLDDAAASIRKVLANPATNTQTERVLVSPETPEAQGVKSYIDEAVAALVTHGRPLRQRVLADRIQERRPEASRASIESSIFRHLSKAKTKRIIRLGRMIGIPGWKQSKETSLVQISQSA
jgi:hypothetical protein